MYTAEPDPTSALGKLQLRAKRVPLWIRVPLLLMAFLLTFVCMALDLPPYSWLVDGQAAAFHGEHYPALSFLVTLIAFLVPVGVALQLGAGLFPDNTPPDPFGQVAPPVGGPPPAYMQSGPYAQGLYGAGPQAPAPPGQAPYGQAPYGQAPLGQAPYGQAPAGQASAGQGPFGPGQPPPPGQGPFGGPGASGRS